MSNQGLNKTKKQEIRKQSSAKTKYSTGVLGRIKSIVTTPYSKFQFTKKKKT